MLEERTRALQARLASAAPQSEGGDEPVFGGLRSAELSELLARVTQTRETLESAGKAAAFAASALLSDLVGRRI